MDVQDFIVNRDQHMRPLEYDLSENFNTLLRYMQDVGVLDNVPVGVTSESEIVSISDAYPAPPRALTVFGKSTQDGTPTPDAPVEIQSVVDPVVTLAGRNLIPSVLGDGGFVAGYSFSVSGGNATLTENSTTVIYVVPAHAGTLSLGFAAAGTIRYIRVAWFAERPRLGSTGAYLLNVNGGDVQVRTTTVPQDYGYLVFQTSLTNWASGFEARLPMAMYGTVTASDYEPHQATTVTLPVTLRSLPDGTRDELRLSYLRPSEREGWAWYEREVNRAVGHIADMGELAWNAFTYSGTLLMYANIADMIEAQSGITTFLCSGYVTQVSKPIGELTTIPDLNCAPRNTYKQVYVKDSNYTDASAFKAAVAGMTLDYQLATPTTETLDPIELPVLPAPDCTVWCDGGSAQPTIVLEYVRDTNAAIADLSEAIADVVSD